MYVPDYLYGHHTREGHQNPSSESYQQLEATDVGSRQEQQVLVTAELSPAPIFINVQDRTSH